MVSKAAVKWKWSRPACVPKVGSLASRARNDGKMRALFCAQLGKPKFTRLNWLWFVPEANT